MKLLYLVIINTGLNLLLFSIKKLITTLIMRCYKINIVTRDDSSFGCFCLHDFYRRFQENTLLHFTVPRVASVYCSLYFTVLNICLSRHIPFLSRFLSSFSGSFYCEKTGARFITNLHSITFLYFTVKYASVKTNKKQLIFFISHVIELIVKLYMH